LKHIPGQRAVNGCCVEVLLLFKGNSSAKTPPPLYMPLSVKFLLLKFKVIMATIFTFIQCMFQLNFNKMQFSAAFTAFTVA